MATPPAEIEITVDLVEGLLLDQFPQFSEMDISFCDEGWDNVMYHAGPDFLVRLPRRQTAEALLLKEQKYLPYLADRLPVAIPKPIYNGKPTSEYRWNWSIIPWIEGDALDISSLSRDQASTFISFLKALHVPAQEAPSNPHRGVPLSHRELDTKNRIAAIQSESISISSKILSIWESGLKADKDFKARWIHGDLHARNVIGINGKLAGVIDWGDMCGGDVATDLSAIWSLFDDKNARSVCLELYEADKHLIARAKGWAVFFAMVLNATGMIDHSRHEAMGKAILRRLEEDF